MQLVRNRSLPAILCVAVFLTAKALAVPPPIGIAPVSPPPNGFSIDGDLLANSPVADIGDWLANTNLATGIGGGVLTLAGLPINTSRTFHLHDPYNGNDNIFKGGMKWRDNPNLWQWTTGKPSTKTDINNALLHITSDTNGHVWVVVAADRYSTAGSSYIDFEFLQSVLTTNANSTFTSAGTNGGRTVGDLLFSLAFVGGGSTPEFLPYRWQTNGAGGFDYADATAMLPAGRFFMGVNTNTISVPYGAFGQTSYAPNAFAEAAIDLTALLGNFDQCATFGFKTIMIKTKSSTSDTSSIEDFITPFQYTLRIGPDAQAGPDQVRCTEGAETVFPLAGSAGSGLSTITSATWSVVAGNATIDDVHSLVTTSRVSSASATLRLTVVQANGCTQTDDIVLSVQQPPVYSITGVTNTCPRTTNTFSAPAGMTSYAWSVSGNGTISGPANQATVKVVAGAACGTNLILSLTAVTNVCTVSSALEIAVTDNTLPVLTIPADRILDCPAVTTTNVTGVATATDSCSRATVSYSDEITIGCGAGKIIARTWIATDECGNTVSAVQTITVRDITPPVITCPVNRTLEYPADISPTANGVATAVDACSTATVTSSDVITTNCGNTFVITRTWTATDACNNSSSCVQTITVRDNTAPVITCPLNVVLDYPADISTNNTGIASATDVGGTVTIGYADTFTTNCANTFVVARRWTATDQCGNQSSCTQTITVRDITGPLISSPPNLTLECPAITTTNQTGVATATDESGPVTIGFTDSVTNLCGNTKVIARRWTATDLCGNQSSSTQMITVADITAPVIVCPGDKRIECGTPWTFDIPTASDTCGTNTIAILNTVTNAGCGNTFTATRTWRATDACGNQSQCSQTVSVVDTTPPIVTAAPDKSVECTVPWTFDPPTATDGCGTVTIKFLWAATNRVNFCGNNFSATVRWEVRDQCGNAVVVAQNVYAYDATPPVITCVSNKTVQCGAAWTFNQPTASDTCDTASISVISTVTNSICGNTFIATRTWRAKDRCDNYADCSQTVTVVDTTPPVLKLPANRVLDCPGDTRTNFTGVATATDNCGSVTIAYSDIVSNGCGMSRTVQRTWTATDQCGNSANGVQTISVPNVAPTMACKSLSVQCVSDIPAPYADLSAFRAAGGTATSSCDTSLSFALMSDSGLVGHCPGRITRVYRVTDDCGEFAECTQVITVDDTIAPAITCPASVTLECGAALDPAALGSATAIDNCATNVAVTYSDTTVDSTYNLKWYASDPDSGTGPFAPTYLKFAPGSLPCPSGGRAIDPLRNAVAFAPNGQLDALTSLGNVPMSFGQIVPFQLVIEASGGPGTDRGTIEFTSSWSTYTTSNDRFGFDTNHMVYCAFVDPADPGSIDPHFNAKVESFSSTVINRGAIDEKIQGTFRVSGLNSGDRVIVEVWVALMSAMPEHAGGTIASDLVAARKLSSPPQDISIGAQTVSIGNLSKIGTLPPPASQPSAPAIPPQPVVPPGETVSIIDRTWAAIDDCGNRSTCVQRITVRDTTPPALVIPSDRILEYPADLSTNNTGTAIAQDGCGLVTISYSDVVNTNCGVGKTISRTWTAIDQSGNATNAVQLLTVRDTLAPTISCPADKTVECGSDTSTSSLGTALAADFSGSLVLTFEDTITPTCGTGKTISRRWTASDACGNTASCTQTITVHDTTPPTITPLANKTIYSGSALIFDVPTATDTSGTAVVSVVSTTTNKTSADIYCVTRLWKATDACNNFTNTAQAITVELPPITKLMISRMSTGTMLLRWPTNTIDYRLEWSDSVSAERWYPVAVTPIVTNGENRVYHVPTGPWRFFRLNNSAPYLDSAKTNGGKMRLTWPTAPAGFQLESSDTMSPGSWSPVAITPGVSNALNHVEVQMNSPKRFFRLRK